MKEPAMAHDLPISRWAHLDDRKGPRRTHTRASALEVAVIVFAIDLDPPVLLCGLEDVPTSGQTWWVLPGGPADNVSDLTFAARAALRDQSGLELGIALPIDVHGRAVGGTRILAVVIDEPVDVDPHCGWLPLAYVLRSAPLSDDDLQAISDAADLFHLR
jgi:hypothetical protein